MQRCVDKDDMVVDDQNCQAANQNSPYRYHWYYGGAGGYVRGTAASGGSYSPHAGFDPVPSSAASAHSSVTRGGFGAAGESMGHSS
jgi:hypothetical protein